MPFNLFINKLEVLHLWANPANKDCKYPIVILEDEGETINRFSLTREACAVLWEELETWKQSETLADRARLEERDGLINIEHPADTDAYYAINNREKKGEV